MEDIEETLLRELKEEYPDTIEYIDDLEDTFKSDEFDNL